MFIRQPSISRQVFPSLDTSVDSRNSDSDAGVDLRLREQRHYSFHDVSDRGPAADRRSIRNSSCTGEIVDHLNLITPAIAPIDQPIIKRRMHRLPGRKRSNNQIRSRIASLQQMGRITTHHSLAHHHPRSPSDLQLNPPERVLRPGHISRCTLLLDTIRLSVVSGLKFGLQTLGNDSRTDDLNDRRDFPAKNVNGGVYLRDEDPSLDL